MTVLQLEQPSPWCRPYWPNMGRTHNYAMRWSWPPRVHTPRSCLRTNAVRMSAR